MEIKLEKWSKFLSQKSKNRMFDFINDLDLLPSNLIQDQRFLDVSEVVVNKIADIIPSENERKVLIVNFNSSEEINLFIEHGYKVVVLTSDEKIKAKYENSNFEMLLMHQSFLEFTNKSFDIIWAKQTLQKSLFPLYTITEFFRTLKDDGLLYIETPSDKNEFEKNNKSDISLFSKEIWYKNIETVGFNIIDTVDVNLQSENAGFSDLYWLFFCTKYKKSTLQNVQEQATAKVYMALSKGENFGWGVCSKYLNQEISKLYNKTVIVEYDNDQYNDTVLQGKVFHALTGIEFESISKVRGTENYGYTFFENEILPNSIKNAKKYDLVIGGSTWCKEKMVDAGINNVDVLIQGIDPDVFYPVENKQNEGMFVIFSGGKFELRKGQDAVLKAVSILQKKYPNIVLVNAWYNMWPQTMDLMYNSPYIKFEHYGQTWLEQMNKLYELNDIDASRVVTYDIIPNTQLRDLYALTDVGVFPNRCEGGTNLVMMEYMACGRPVIASYTSGHKDVLTDKNSYPLKQTKPFRLYDNNNKLWADWEDISIIELVDKIEFAYNNVQDRREKGKIAGVDLKNFTWKKSAENLLKIMGI